MVAYRKPKTEPQPRLTSQEYLAQERKAQARNEYHNGVIVAISGAPWEHNVIAGNIHGELHSQLKGKPCLAIMNDLRVRVPECNQYYYPDVVVVCGTPKFEDAEFDTLLNPTMLIEVLSESTEAIDRGEKWECYQTLPSLNTYILVSQDRPRVEVYRRGKEDWSYSHQVGLTGVLALEAIGCTLRLEEVYARIEFAESSQAEETRDTEVAGE